MKELMMADIADLANVSIKTVSRVINNSPQVKDSTRKKVMEIIAHEGYMVNIAAQGLRGRKTKTIIIFIDEHNGNYWNIWHNTIINIIINESKKNRYKIVISPSSAHGVVGDETDGFYLLKSRMADGAIIFDNKENDIRIKYLNENNIPYVLVGKGDEQYKSYYVDVDNYNVGFLGGKYLIDKKFKAIVQFVGSKEFIVNKERVRGFKDSITSQHITAEVYFDIDSMEKSYHKAGELLDIKRVDAFFISGDERALGVYRAIFERNLKIPDDVAVLGVDNIELSKFLYPSLTTIDQSIDKLGQETLNMLVDQLTKQKIKTRKVIIEPRIIERDSVM